MSISTELTRLQTGRNKIRAKLTALGLAQSTDKLDVLATAIEGITDNGAALILTSRHKFAGKVTFL